MVEGSESHSTEGALGLRFGVKVSGLEVKGAGLKGPGVERVDIAVRVETPVPLFETNNGTMLQNPESETLHTRP
jgi:hypothetical protein